MLVETAPWAPSALAALVLAVHALLLTLSYVALRKIRRAPRRHVDRAPRVTIFKPLAGKDDDLAANLESFARLDYPAYEILFGVASPLDPAHEVARSFLRAHPEVDARVVVTDPDVAMNPKVAQLVGLSAVATGEVFVISDSNVRVPKDYLWSLLAELARPGTGLVTSVIAGTGERTLGAALENLQLATVVAPAVVLSNVTRRPFTIGKSMAIWRRDLAKIGGFSAFSDVLAEDHVLGDAVLALGLAIRTSLAPIENRNVACSTRRTLERHARWAKIRKSLSLGFWGEPLGAPLVLLTFLCLAFPSRLLFALLVASALVQTVAAFAFVKLLRGKPLAWKYAPLEIARTYAIFACWLWATVSDRVVWRGHPFRVLSGSRIVPAPVGVFRRLRVTAR